MSNARRGKHTPHIRIGVTLYVTHRRRGSETPAPVCVGNAQRAVIVLVANPFSNNRYNSGDEKVIMNEFDVGSNMTLGEASAVARKIARDARDGTRRMGEDREGREREQLALLGIVPDRDRVLDDENNLETNGGGEGYRNRRERLLANYVIQYKR